MKCSVEGCEHNAKYVGLCGMHYKRKWRHGNVDINLTPPLKPKHKCKVEECENMTTHDSGYCSLHLHRLNRYNRLYNIVNRGSGWTMDSNGYVRLWINGKWEFEHRVLAEKALGKKLPEGAVIHHTEEPWVNYGFCKLVICPDQAYHLLLHQRMKERRGSI